MSDLLEKTKLAEVQTSPKQRGKCPTEINYTTTGCMKLDDSSNDSFLRRDIIVLEIRIC
jgi:hypothetical protein